MYALQRNISAMAAKTDHQHLPLLLSVPRCFPHALSIMIIIITSARVAICCHCELVIVTTSSTCCQLQCHSTLLLLVNLWWHHTATVFGIQITFTVTVNVVKHSCALIQPRWCKTTISLPLQLRSRRSSAKVYLIIPLSTFHERSSFHSFITLRFRAQKLCGCLLKSIIFKVSIISFKCKQKFSNSASKLIGGR